MVHPLAAFAVGFVLLISLAGTYVGWKQSGVYDLVAETEVVPAGSIDGTESDPVAVEGHVAENATTFEAPISGDQAVLSAWRVEEYEKSRHEDSGDWSPQLSRVTSEPFAVEDGTVGVTVDPGDHETEDSHDLSARDGVAFEDAVFEFEEFPRREVSVADETPPEIERFVEETPGLDRQRDSSGEFEDEVAELMKQSEAKGARGDRRYYHRTIAPGDRVYVRGAVEPGGGHGQRRIVAPDDGRMVVSDQSKESLDAELGSSRKVLYGGIVVSLACLGALGYLLGSMVGMV